MGLQKLSLEDIKKLVHGAARVEEIDGRVELHRFTKEQQELYKAASPNDYYIKSFSTSGISLEFDTDSEYLGLAVAICPGSSRRFFTHSILVDGERVGELSGEIERGAEHVPFEKVFQLKSGMKRVRIVMPWSVDSKLVALELDENAKVIPVEKNLKVLMFGDSITQGYDAMQPENAYAVQIATKLNAEAINKGIGGERFRPALAALKEEFEPNLITVAYGTNDWSHSTKEELDQACKEFYVNLRKSYPNVKIYAMAPIWRSSLHDKKIIGLPLSYVVECLREVAKEVEDMIVVDCFDFIPHELENFQTDGLHPIDLGFEHYVKNFWNVIGK